MPTTNKASKPKPMTKKNLQHFEKRLLEERRRVLKELGRADEAFGNTPQSADGDLSSYSFHMADQGTDAMEREKAFLFASQEGRFLWHIDEALRRLYRNPDAFGKCHNCGQEIAFERLDALPHARYCIDCKQREEAGRRASSLAGVAATRFGWVVSIGARAQSGRGVRAQCRRVLALHLHGSHDRRARDSGAALS
jgi:RNA polymerase-binding protein DksA